MIEDIINKLAKEQNDVIGTRFIAPVIGNRLVAIRIAGIIQRLKPVGLPQGFSMGFVVLRVAEDLKTAVYERECRFMESREYKDSFPHVRCVLVERLNDQTWSALLVNDGRFESDDLVTVNLTSDGLRQFQTVDVTFDGNFFWYNSVYMRRNPAISASMRRSLIDGALYPRIPGSNPTERKAYILAQKLITETVEDRLKNSVGHMNGRLIEYTERSDSYVVTYEVDGHRYRSTVRSDDLTVMTAGICLDGGDSALDLTSLVSVLRDGQDRRLIYRTDRSL